MPQWSEYLCVSGSCGICFCYIGYSYSFDSLWLIGLNAYKVAFLQMKPIYAKKSDKVISNAFMMMCAI